MSNNRTENEQRLFGALTLITKGVHFLAIHDQGKLEASSQIDSNEWWQPHRVSWGLPGGGRGKNERALPETLRETLQNELDEEFPVSPIALPRRTKDSGIVQQPHPIVVAQLTPTTIQQFGVTSLRVPVERFNIFSQGNIERAIDIGQAAWISFEQVMDILNSQGPMNEEFHGHVFRPQVLATAALWHLHEAGKLEVAEVWKSNAELIKFVQAEAAVLNRPIRNGSFENSGQPYQHLNRRDRQFLGL